MLREKRRTLDKFDALAVGGPLDGLRLEFWRMSDGSFKLNGGQAFDVAGYTLDADTRTYSYKAAP